MEYIILLGAFQAFLALGLFIASRQKKPADHLLTWILICIFTHLSIKFIIYTASGNTDLKTAFNTFIDLAYGPLLWMYARKVIHDHYRPVQHWYFLLPTLTASFFYAAIVLKMLVAPAGTGHWLQWYNDITTYVIIATMTLFPVMSLHIARQLPAFWQSERQLIRKIACCFLLTPVIWITTQLINTFQLLDGPTVNVLIRIVAYSNMLVICLFIIQYKLAAQALLSGTAHETPPVEQPDFPPLTVLREEKDTLVIAVSEEPAPRKSQLTLPQREAIAEKLSRLMLQQKVYTDPGLTLEKLSSLVKIPRHHLSEVLNQYLHQPFYQYINDYRMKEVLRLLDQCRQQQVTPNILSLAYEAGFNSKSSFNQYFKKTTGYTPTEYLKQPPRKGTESLPPSFMSLQ